MLDLGCGAGMLAIAARACGAGVVVGVDTDEDALADAAANLAALDMRDEVDLIRSDAHGFCGASRAAGALQTDTVITNPPFGTRTAGADVAFLASAASLRPAAIYSLHKTSTRSFLLAKAAELGYSAEAVAEMSFPLPKAYAFHRKDEGEVAVDLLRLVPAAEGAATRPAELVSPAVSS